VGTDCAIRTGSDTGPGSAKRCRRHICAAHSKPISGDGDRLRLSIRRLLLPPRRPRAYPRAVKIKMSGYAKKCRRLPSRRKRPLPLPPVPRTRLIHEAGGRLAK